MSNLRIEITDHDILHIHTTEGTWAHSTFPQELLTIDYDQNGKVVGIEALGSAAVGVMRSCKQALADISDHEDWAAAVDQLIDTKARRDT